MFVQEASVYQGGVWWTHHIAVSSEATTYFIHWLRWEAIYDDV